MKRSSAFREKFSLTLFLIREVWRQLPGRLVRMIRHAGAISIYFSQTQQFGLSLRLPARIFFWAGEGLFLVLDIAGMPEWYEIGSLWLKPYSRRLKEEEISLARSVFGDSLPYYRIRLDERAHLGPRQYQFCYVSFCVVNSWREMDPAILIHELVHVWQFKRFGSPYILRALLAQRTAAGYDYGGPEKLNWAAEQHLGFAPFNYEQQASIVEDYYRLLQNSPLQWGRAPDPGQLVTYQYFIRILRS